MKYLVSDSPHIRGKRTTRGIMLDVLIALLPATVVGCIYFGGAAVASIAISVVSAVAAEVVFRLIKRENIKDILLNFDLTSVVTGLLLALTLPSQAPWYVPMLSSIFAIVVVKMLFGGTGKNLVNPAITGRVFAFIAFQSVMVSGWLAPSIGAISPVAASGASGSVSTGATQLTSMLGGNGLTVSDLDLFLGTGVAGCIGETCKLALLIGGIYLVIRRVIKWEYPVIYIVVTGLVACAIGKDIGLFVPSILSGGLFLGAIFMATDYVTSPHTRVGNWIYMALLGVVTAALRAATKIEVVSFAILLMNLLVPMFNAYIRPRVFGAPSFVKKFKVKLAEAREKRAQKTNKEDAQ